jgi:hypothetical protein
MKKAGNLIVPSKDLRPLVWASISKNVVRSLHWNAVQNHDVTLASRSLETVAHFKYFGMTETSKHNSGRKYGRNEGCYHSVQTFYLFVCCIKDARIEIYCVSA